MLQGKYKEAEALKRADALILEEEQEEREGAERQAARAAAERERRHRKRVSPRWTIDGPQPYQCTLLCHDGSRLYPRKRGQAHDSAL